MTIIKYALHNDDPAYALAKAHAEDACYDLVARCYLEYPDFAAESEKIVLPPQRRCLAKTGVFLEMEPGWEALVRPRSGNALKKGLTIVNTPGTVDAGYRNEIGVILHNLGPEPQELTRGLKIAQIAFRRIPDFDLKRVATAEFDADTARSLKGFGSSGA